MPEKILTIGCANAHPIRISVEYTRRDSLPDLLTFSASPVERVDGRWLMLYDMPENVLTALTDVLFAWQDEFATVRASPSNLQHLVERMSIRVAFMFHRHELVFENKWIARDQEAGT